MVMLDFNARAFFFFRHTNWLVRFSANKGALLVYDITNRDSFKKMQNWVKELRKMLGQGIAYVLDFTMLSSVNDYSHYNIVLLLLEIKLIYNESV
jgi:GTPase SAR1 family protein